MADFFADNSAVLKAWYRKRRRAIIEHVSAYQVLRRFGVTLRQSSDNATEQISCPFHGEDRKPSARVYPDEADSPSHVYCYVCRERWDAVALWHKFLGNDKIGQTVATIERDLGLTPPEKPSTEADLTEVNEAEREEVRKLLGICERRLLATKKAFPMKAYLTVSSVLDKTWSRLESGKATPDTARKTVEKVLGKIGERACEM